MPFCLFIKTYARYEMLTCSHIICCNSFRVALLTQSFPHCLDFLGPALVVTHPKLPLTSTVFRDAGHTGSPPEKVIYCILGARAPTTGQFTSLYNSILLQMMGTEVPLSEELGKWGRAKAEVSPYTKADKLTE